MNKNLVYYFIIIIVFAQGCSSPKLITIKKYPRIDNLELIYVIDKDNLGINDAEEIGFIEIGDLELTWSWHGMEDCSYYEVLRLAKRKASEIGGNIIVVTEHRLPSTLGSACHRIKAKVFRSENPENLIQCNNKKAQDENIVILNIFRPRQSSMALITCTLKLNNSTICKVKNGYAETITFNESQRGELIGIMGIQKFKADVLFEKGHTYYILCSTEGVGGYAEPYFYISENDERLELEFKTMKK